MDIICYLVYFFIADILENMVEHQKYNEDILSRNENEENFQPSQGSNSAPVNVWGLNLIYNMPVLWVDIHVFLDVLMPLKVKIFGIAC